MCNAVERETSTPDLGLAYIVGLTPVERTKVENQEVAAGSGAWKWQLEVAEVDRIREGALAMGAAA